MSRTWLVYSKPRLVVVISRYESQHLVASPQGLEACIIQRIVVVITTGIVVVERSVIAYNINFIVNTGYFFFTTNNMDRQDNMVMNDASDGSYENSRIARFSYIEDIRRPPVYNGDRNPRILESWILSFERYGRLKQVPDDIAVELAGNYFNDEAMHWFNSLGQEVQGMSWNEFKNMLITRFSDPLYHHRIMDEWDNLQQRSSVTGYTNQFEQLKRLLPQDQRTPDEGLRKYIKGLKYNTRISVEANRPTNLKDAQYLAFTYDQGNTVNGTPPRRINIRHNFNNNGLRNDRSNSIPMEIDNTQVSRKPNKTKMNVIKCYNCGRVGHFKSNCPKGRRQ